MSTTCPTPFPANGQSAVTHEQAMQRMQAMAHQLPAKLSTDCESRIQVGIFFDGTNNMKQLAHFIGYALLSLCSLFALSGCDGNTPTWAVSYGAVNHTDKYIVAISINGEGGVLTAPMHGQGGGVCCVIVPQRWTPGLSVTVKWEEDGKLIRDEKGNIKYFDGAPKYIPGPVKTQTVPLPKYDKEGRFFVFFFPGDVVKVALTSSPEWDEWYAPTEEDLKHGNRVKRNYENAQ